ncbi:MAG: arsenate reductase family protein [Bdellovibrionales bacterium]|nr:arsenate reductase family protein [Bdellovibrionales bacterium]
MTVKVYEYAACSTCRNALKWLTQHQVKFTAIPIVDQPPSLTELKGYVQRSGLPLAKFFNTSGLVYREMQLGKKLPTLTDEEKLKLLASNGKLIKRPLVVAPQGVLVGFQADAYAQHFSK